MSAYQAEMFPLRRVDDIVDQCAALWDRFEDARARGDAHRAIEISKALVPLRVQIRMELDVILWQTPTDIQQRPEVISRYENLSCALWHKFERILTAAVEVS